MKWQRIRLFLKLISHFSERCKIAVSRWYDKSDLIGEAMFYQGSIPFGFRHDVKSINDVPGRDVGLAVHRVQC